MYLPAVPVSFLLFTCKCEIVAGYKRKLLQETNVSMNIDLLSMKLFTSITFPSECYVKFLHEYAVVGMYIP